MPTSDVGSPSFELHALHGIHEPTTRTRRASLVRCGAPP
ncbi:hypothetical protein I552_2503 [Mycobacterium xenopi 3993]|nr:hypothetical protein I552_2503 [Mycobacterium xenopi 3993]